MHFEPGDPGRLILRDADTVVAEYIYEPVEPQLESPRPHLLLRTRGGRDVTAYRPEDHVWHKGLSLALPVVGTHNFWGGPTYVGDEGYVQLPNNGAQVHTSFAASDTPVAEAAGGVARLDERLDWVTEQGDTLLREARTITARPVAGDAWALTWRSALRNETTDAVTFGSPTTKGRENAGYAGIFWRGPTEFTGGAILGPDGEVGDTARGEPGAWLAFVAPDDSAGILVLDAAEAANPWFARSAEYAGLSPAPFFFDETALAPGDTLVLAAAFVIGGADVARFASTVGANLAAELRAQPLPDEARQPPAGPTEAAGAAEAATKYGPLHDIRTFSAESSEEGGIARSSDAPDAGDPAPATPDSETDPATRDSETATVQTGADA